MQRHLCKSGQLFTFLFTNFTKMLDLTTTDSRGPLKKLDLSGLSFAAIGLQLEARTCSDRRAEAHGPQGAWMDKVVAHVNVCPSGSLCGFWVRVWLAGKMV